jgi:hypothetical protein
VHRRLFGFQSGAPFANVVPGCDLLVLQGAANEGGAVGQPQPVGPRQHGPPSPGLGSLGRAETVQVIRWLDLDHPIMRSCPLRSSMADVRACNQ